MNKEDWGNIQLAGIFGLLAGYINVLSIEIFGVTVSHLTGIVSKIGINFLHSKPYLAFIGIGLWCCYVLGATTGKYIKDRMGISVSLFLEGGIFIALGTFVSREMVYHSIFWAGFSGLVATFGMGIQNVITSSTSMDKTTHLTGASTELGLAIADKDWGNFFHMGVIIGGFLVGALIALLAEHLIGIKGFILPGIVIIAVTINRIQLMSLQGQK